MFRFKQFQVEHDRSSMKVGTDGVLLGSWCDVSHASRVLDVGTGCGLIALMVAQRNSISIVDAIDIDVASVGQAAENFKKSPWAERLNAINADYCTFECTNKYDLIVSNPPFFTNGVLSPNEVRRNARHTQSLTFEQLIVKSKSILTDAGILSIVTPVDAYKDILDICMDNDLYVSKICKVYSMSNLPVKRLLWNIVMTPTKTICDDLVIEASPGNYSDDFINLCRDFYLKF